VLKVGLTGGIGSGKSSVSALLASYGAVVVDADLLAREVVAPGSDGLGRVVAEFGDDLLLPDGSLDRPALGRRVFGDPERLAALNAVLHPLIAARTVERFAEAEAAGAQVLVHDVALLVENGLAPGYDAVVVVAAEPATQLDRLVRLRGMAEADAQARIAAQSSLADKLAVATDVVHNDGPVEDLEPQVAALWQRWTGQPPADRSRDTSRAASGASGSAKRTSDPAPGTAPSSSVTNR
jgi:dephospho-CoA kinase